MHFPIHYSPVSSHSMQNVLLSTYTKDGQQTRHKRSDYTTQVNLRKQTYLRSNNIEIAVSLRTVAKYQIRRTQH
jgi:uncharacterized protein YxeA